MINFSHKLLAIVLIAGATLSLNAQQRPLSPNARVQADFRALHSVPIDSRVLRASTVFAACNAASQAETREYGERSRNTAFSSCLVNGGNRVVPSELDAFNAVADPIIKESHARYAKH